MTEAPLRWAGTHINGPNRNNHKTGESDLPFVWLHGWGQTHQSLMRLAETVSDLGDHQLYDQPGFGDTPNLPEDAGTAHYAADLLGQMPDQTTVMVGHSFGCRVAIRMAYAQPERVKALILIAGAGLRPRRSLAKRIRSTLLKLGSRIAGVSDKLFGTELKRQYAKRFGSADYKNAGTLRTTFVKTVNEDLAPLVKGIKCPVLLITGADDTETPPYMAERYRDLMPNATCHIVSGFGHLDILSRGVYQCEGLIRDFVGRLP